MSEDEKISKFQSPKKERPFTPIVSPIPNKLTLQQYNSFSKCSGDYENLFNDQGVHSFKCAGVFPQYSPALSPQTTRAYCTCKKTECLKYYCPCFSSGRPCSQQCRCEGCKNTEEKYNQEQRNFSKQQKIFCTCKKTSCLKKYCICFLNGKKCGIDCKCEGCENCNQEQSPKKKYQKKIGNTPKIKKKVKKNEEIEKLELMNKLQSTAQKTTSKKGYLNFEEEKSAEKKQESGKKTANQKDLIVKKQLIKK